uniref:F-box domain-containing protein n=1 Tax=Mycena chlorophos TaxID=658473 RepID=A0ABQ0L4F0_MYCCL|nr:predicted protein [Mycena chlorophos]
MNFQELPEDVLRIVFGLLDVYCVLCLSATSKSLRVLATDRLVWVDLLLNLHWHGFVDDESVLSISRKSQAELLDLVQTMVLGPRHWRRQAILQPSAPDIVSNIARPAGDSPSPNFEPLREHVLHPQNINLARSNEARLLPGGEYVLLDTERALECWSVQDGRIVWSHHEDNGFVGGFAFDMLPGGRQVNIAVFIYQLEHGWASSRLDILELDLLQETSEMRYTSPYSAVENDVHWTHSDIKGSFAVCNLFSTIRGSTELHALHDWKTAPGKCLSVASPEGSQLALTTRYLIIATFDPRPSIRETQFRIVSLVDLQSVGPWYGFFNDASSINVAELPTLSNFVFPLSVATILDLPPMHHLSVYRSPLDENVYRIWLHWAGFRRLEVEQGQNRVTFGNALYGYHLLANPDNACDVSLHKRVESRTGSKGNTTYSGHGIRRQRLRDHLESDSYALYAPGEPDPVASLRATGAALFPSLSVYSGAVTYAERVVRVAYFD